MKKSPSEILDWCLDDITLIYSSIYFEEQEMMRQQEELENKQNNG